MRINARLDREHEEKLQYLSKTTRRNYSEVVKEALDLYYAKTRGEADDALAVLRNAGFVGVADGDEDLSERYKERLDDGFGQKHGYR